MSFQQQGSRLQQVFIFLSFECFHETTVGCTLHPSPGERFCNFHKDHSSPALAPNQLSKDSLAALNNQHTNRENFLMTGLERDNIFVVEGIFVCVDLIWLKYFGYQLQDFRCSEHTS